MNSEEVWPSDNFWDNFCCMAKTKRSSEIDMVGFIKYEAYDAFSILSCTSSYDFSSPSQLFLPPNCKSEKMFPPLPVIHPPVQLWMGEYTLLPKKDKGIRLMWRSYRERCLYPLYPMIYIIWQFLFHIWLT